MQVPRAACPRTGIIGKRMHGPAAVMTRLMPLRTYVTGSIAVGKACEVRFVSGSQSRKTCLQL